MVLLIKKNKEDINIEIVSRILYGLIVSQSLIVYLWFNSKTAFEALITLFSTMFLIAIAEIYVSFLISNYKKYKENIEFTFKYILYEEFAIFRFTIIPSLLFIFSIFNLIPLEITYYISTSIGVLILFYIGIKQAKILGKKVKTQFFFGSLNALIGLIIILIKAIFK